MSRIPVVIASLLKPVDDTRMYEKLGLSLAQTNKYEINIIGFFIKKINFHPGVRTFPIFNMPRSGISRIFQPLKFLILLLKVKPEVTIVSSPDLLLVTLFYSGITRTQFIYDIQENYLRNILFNSKLPWPVKFPAALLVRMLERIVHPFVDHYLVAEEAYFNEMPYLKKKGILLRNYYVPIYRGEIIRGNIGKRITILYTGTIAEAYGIFQVIQFIDRFHAFYQGIELRIAGYCPHRGTLEKLQEAISGKSYIYLTGGENLLPHEEILREIREADFGIVFYELNPAIRNCFPTRIYEYMANRLPILIQDHPRWTDLCIQHNACLVVDFEYPEIAQLLSRMRETKFYNHGVPETIFWKKEEPKLLHLFEKILPED